jgi:NADH-quinone oxidoreductase subunit E
MAKTLTPEAKKEFDWIVSRYPVRRAALLPTLRLIEKEFGRVDPEGIALAAELCQLSTAEVQGVVSFYTHYKRETDGKYVIWVCNTLPCALRGARDLTTALEKKLACKAWETTKDGRFTLKKAECLASCDTAPCLQVDEDHYDHVTEAKLDEILGRYS